MARNSSQKAYPGRRWLWITLGAAAYALHLLLGKNSSFIESVYSRIFYPGLRWAWDFTFGLSPLPFSIVFLVGAAGWQVRRVIRSVSSRRTAPKSPRPPLSWRARAGRTIHSLAAWIGGLVFFFYVLWGFNYNRMGIESQLDLEVRPLAAGAVREEAEWAARMLAETRGAVPGATESALGREHLPANLEDLIRKSLSGVLRDMGYPTPGRIRVRTFRPGGWMMRLSGTGFYFPYFGEGYVSANICPFQKPAVIAHEMAHGFGIGDEGTAGFLGFLACEASENPVVRYSGFLTFWNSIAGDLLRTSRKSFQVLWNGLPAGVKADQRAVRENWEHYRGPLMKAGQAIYERYLKSQGIEEGMLSYDRLVTLVAAWKQKRQGTGMPSPES